MANTKPRHIWSENFLQTGTLQLLAALLSAVRGTQGPQGGPGSSARKATIGCEYCLVSICWYTSILYIYIAIYIHVHMLNDVDIWCILMVNMNDFHDSMSENQFSMVCVPHDSYRSTWDGHHPTCWGRITGCRTEYADRHRNKADPPIQELCWMQMGKPFAKWSWEVGHIPFLIYFHLVFHVFPLGSMDFYLTFPRLFSSKKNTAKTMCQRSPSWRNTWAVCRLQAGVGWIGGFHSHGGTRKWMVFMSGKILLKWMI